VTRRQFLHGTALATAGVIASRANPSARPRGASPWRARMGLELYTVRDLLAVDYEGTLAKVAALGYTEVEPTTYSDLPAKDVRAMLDRHGLSMPSTHAPARGEGAELERALEDFQVIGLTYTELPPDPVAPASLEAFKRRAAALNARGRITQRFGIKVFVHNHTSEFEPLAAMSRSGYDVLLDETDPALVAMQIDIGWASIAGVDPLALFRAHPGRFELWHVKDVFGLQTASSSLSIEQRVRSTMVVPVGTGQVDWKAMFAQATRAGLKHFAIEQDNAATWGDSLAAARVSFQNLAAILDAAG
jgi:sugar phosphate isomerase/epimerase